MPDDGRRRVGRLRSKAVLWAALAMLSAAASGGCVDDGTAASPPQANSTPATDGRYVVAVFPTAGLACLNMSGEILWQHDLGGLNAGAFSDPGIEWGFASSPILYGSTVILQADTHDGPYLAAWDLESG
ncbi:MAG: hypothetical protein ACO3P9_11240, partial [Phycisphaerales bacterium]